MTPSVASVSGGPRKLRLYYQVRARYPEFSWRCTMASQGNNGRSHWAVRFSNYPVISLEDGTMVRPPLADLAADPSLLASRLSPPESKRVTDATLQRYHRRRRRRIQERRERDGREP